MDSGASPYCGPVVDLVDPYATKEDVPAVAETLMGWMREHPGRWILFLDGEYGFDRGVLAKAGFEVSCRTTKAGIRKGYARMPHPQGESLSAALARSQELATYPADLPRLSADEFHWTKEELERACQMAREELFPVRAARGSGRKR